MGNSINSIFTAEEISFMKENGILANFIAPSANDLYLIEDKIGWLVSDIIEEAEAVPNYSKDLNPELEHRIDLCHSILDKIATI